MTEQKASIPQHERDEKGAWKAHATPVHEDREVLELIVRCDPSILLRHIEEDTAYDARLIGTMLELAKERARDILTKTHKSDFLSHLRKELMLSKMTHNFTFTRDEVIELLGGKFALLSHNVPKNPDKEREVAQWQFRVILGEDKFGDWLNATLGAAQTIQEKYLAHYQLRKLFE
jgi:hypothetical protein